MPDWSAVSASKSACSALSSAHPSPASTNTAIRDKLGVGTHVQPLFGDTL